MSDIELGQEEAIQEAEPAALAPTGDREPEDEILISAHDLSKCYLIYNDPKDRLKQAFWGHKKDYFRRFWALRDVNFELKRGRSLGIIGRNGCGKSTLLQLVAGILEPTTGSVQTRGRVAALLELGSGFNPDYTGRDNVYLNGSILGLSQAAMDEYFHNIVEFADIGDFIDMPVKTYSSGMMLRLAFATAINVKADVLIVDEALAVGDVGFQAKCFERLDEMLSEGLTLLFVSHDPESITRLCSEVLYLEHGEPCFQGDPKEAMNQYFRSLYAHNEVRIKKPLPEEEAPPAPEVEVATVSEQQVEEASPEIADEDAPPSDGPFRLLQQCWERQIINSFDETGRWGDRDLELLALYVMDDDGNHLSHIEYGEPMTLLIHARANRDLEAVDVGYHIRDSKSLPIMAATNFNVPSHVGPLKEGEHLVMKYRIDMRLRCGPYLILIGLSAHPPGAGHYDWIPQARLIEVIDTKPHQPSGWGMVMLPYEYDVWTGQPW